MHSSYGAVGAGGGGWDGGSSSTAPAAADDMAHIHASLSRLRAERIHVERMRSEGRRKDARIGELEAELERTRRAAGQMHELQTEVGRYRAQLTLAEDRCRRVEDGAVAKRLELLQDLESTRAREARAAETIRQLEEDNRMAHASTAEEGERLRAEVGRTSVQLEQERALRGAQAQKLGAMTEELEKLGAAAAAKLEAAGERNRGLQQQVNALSLARGEAEEQLRTARALVEKQSAMLEDQGRRVEEGEARAEHGLAAQRTADAERARLQRELAAVAEAAERAAERSDGDVRAAQQLAMERSEYLRAAEAGNAEARQRLAAAEHQVGELGEKLSRCEAELPAQRAALEQGRGAFEEQLLKARDLEARLQASTAQHAALREHFEAHREQTESENRERVRFSQARLDLLSEFCQEEQALHEALDSTHPDGDGGGGGGGGSSYAYSSHGAMSPARGGGQRGDQGGSPLREAYASSAAAEAMSAASAAAAAVAMRGAASPQRHPHFADGL